MGICLINLSAVDSVWPVIVSDFNICLIFCQPDYHPACENCSVPFRQLKMTVDCCVLPTRIVMPSNSVQRMKK